MVAVTGTFSLVLAKGAVLSVPDAAGLQFTCRRGCVWLTLDDDPRDWVLEAGGRFTCPHHRRALVSALEASGLTLRPLAQPSLPTPVAGGLLHAPAVAA